MTAAIAAGRPDWDALATRARKRRRATTALLYCVLVLGSLPVVVPQDLAEAMRAVHEIESGIVWVNTPLNDNDAVPFGGRKLTGSGRELGIEGLAQFRRSKMVMIAPRAEADPEWFPSPDGDAWAAPG